MEPTGIEIDLPGRRGANDGGRGLSAIYSDDRVITAIPRLPSLLVRLLTVTAAVTAGALPGSARPTSAQSLPQGTVLISNMDEGSVWLVDLPSGEQRATIPTRAAPHEIAVSSDGRTAVVTNYGAPGAGNLLQVLDVTSGTVLRELVVEGRERLHGAAFLPGDSLLALTSERTQEILVVSTADGAVRRAMPTGGGAPHMLALGGPWIWTANITGGSIARVDPAGASETGTWAAGTRTEGVATTPDGSEGWTGSMEGGTVVGVRGETGEVVARIEGLGVPYRLAVTPDAATVVVSDPEREQVVLIDRRRGTVARTVDLAAASAAAGLGPEPSPQGFTLTPDGAFALVSVKGIDRIAVIELSTGSVVRFMQAGDGPDGIAFSPVRPAG
jgi:DNA-binding beta-propeller fold protein YncE